MRSLKLDKGEWSYSNRFAEVETAHEWRLTPSQFDACSADDKALMTAYCSTVGRMRAWESMEQARIARKSQKR